VALSLSSLVVKLEQMVFACESFAAEISSAIGVARAKNSAAKVLASAYRLFLEKV